MNLRNYIIELLRERPATILFIINQLNNLYPGEDVHAELLMMMERGDLDVSRGMVKVGSVYAINEQNRYKAARQLTINRGAAIVDRMTEGRKKISWDDADFPPVGREIFRAYARTIEDSHIKLELSRAQVEMLTSSVIVPDSAEPYESPQKEYELYPETFKDFLSRVKDMPWTKKNKMTIGNFIKAVCNYHWLGGWLAYRPEIKGTLTRGSTEPTEVFNDLWEE